MSNDDLLYSQAGPSGGNATASSSPAGAGILQSQQQQALAALSHQKAVQQQQQQHAHAQAQAQAAHAYAAMHAQQQAVNAAAAAAAFAANSQYPTTAPATPHSHTSPQSPVKVTPDTGGGNGSLGGSGAVAASSPFSAAGGGGGGSVASPAGSTFSAGASSAHEHAAMAMAADSAAYGRATGMALAGATGLVGSSPVKGANMVMSQSLGGMDVDQSSSSSPSSSAYGMPPMMPGSGSITPGAASAGTTFAFPGPPAGSTALSSPAVPSQHPAPSMASTSRHHPYAHASRPSLHTQTSASSIPLYLSSPSPVGGPPPTTPPPYGNVAEGALGIPPPPPTATSVAPQRVHSAPAHILTLQTQGTDGLGSPVASAEPDSQGALDQRRFVGDLSQPQQQQQQQQQHPHPRDMSSSDSILHLSTNSAPATTPATLVNPAASYQSGRPPSMTIDTAHASNALASLNAPQSAPPTSMEDSRMMVPTAAATAPAAGYNEKVSAALVLLQKRLPIMGAALSTSETESGQDEEEIWKGIEGAYDELKRIMVKRKDGRRRLSHGSSSNNMVSSRQAYSPCR